VTQATLQQIQGRLNQREVPWVAAHLSPNDPAVTFTPKDGGGVTVVWDRGLPAARPLDDIVEFLASYK
jgi:hypothetical protein